MQVQATGATADRPQVAILALDGLEPSLVREMLAAGQLPHLQALIDKGSMATIDCIIGTVSPVVWTSVATGVTPERHGITDFTVDDVPVTSTVRRQPASWNILPRFNSWPYDPDDPACAPHCLVTRPLISAYVHESTFARMAADDTGHGFWKYHEPDPFREAGQEVDAEELSHLAEVIPNAYRFLDELRSLGYVT
jgi:predicted AlkP superfamily phosphohydrolase/phosphomutase